MPKYLQPLKIGKLTLENNLILAPMAGVNDMAFRLLCKRSGAGLVTTEMISANALARFNSATIRLARLTDEERPVATQLFGQNIENLVKSANILAGDLGERDDVKEIRTDIIDFNLGCPVRKVMQQGAGCALLTRPGKLRGILAALRDAVSLPLTVKMRSGISDKTKNFLEIAGICEECGVDAISVHARTQAQSYSGKADWSVIKKVKENASIPVIGNGDVFSGEDAEEMFEQTGCDGVMVGRGCLGNHNLFAEMIEFLKSGKAADTPTKESQIRQFSEYLSLAERFGVNQGLIKKQALYYLRDFEGSAKMRAVVARCRDIETIKRLVL